MKKKTILKATTGILIITAISKITGFFREVMIAYRFGSTIDTDAYFISYSIYMVIFAFAGAGLGSAIIPIISRIRNENSIREGEYIGCLIKIFTLVSIILIILSYMASKPLVKIFAVGFTGAQLEMTVEYFRIGLPVIFCNFMYSIFEAYSHSKNKFFIVASGGMVVNAVVILYLAIFYEKFGIKGLMVANILAYGLRYIYIYIPVRKDIIYQKGPIVLDDYVKGTFSIMLPIIVSSIVSNVNIAVDRTLASTLIEGSISALQYASTARYAVNSLLIMSIVTVIYPTLSKYIVEGKKEEIRGVFSSTSSLVVIFVVPLTVGMMLLNREIVDVLYARGAFNIEDIAITSSALFYYSIGIAANGLDMLINKVYFAFNDSITTMKTGMVTVMINILLSLLLIGPMGHNGLALATSISATINIAVKIYLLRKKEIEIDWKMMTSVVLKSCISAGVMVMWIKYPYSFLFKYEYSRGVVSAMKLVGAVLSGSGVYFLVLFPFVKKILDSLRD